jgi:hypothetical protein
MCVGGGSRTGKSHYGPAVSARALAATPKGEDTLPRELRTPPLPAAHVPVGYSRQNGW